MESFEEVYGSENLCDEEDWLMANPGESNQVGVRILTAAPELEGVLDAVGELTQRGVVYSIGHRRVSSSLSSCYLGRLNSHLVSPLQMLQ
jgi:N-acetylglucosamine-6-phosphate deacetylase